MCVCPGSSVVIKVSEKRFLTVEGYGERWLGVPFVFLWERRLGNVCFEAKWEGEYSLLKNEYV